MSDGDRVLALSGGVGGAKLALGLYRILPAGSLTVVANTGDDFEHLGLSISPDLDTLLYTLGGLDHPEQGWGRRDETWNFMAALEQLGGETWFRLGDRDLAAHVERTRRLKAGEPLSAIVADFARRFGIAARILPMSDDRVRTRLYTGDGWLDFQDYFVRRRCAPAVREIAFAGAGDARPHPEALAALADPRLAAIVICPSNPFISIDPILSLPGFRAALRASPAPVVAVSPIIAGRAVKGPTAKMMEELGLPVDAAAVARHYAGLIDLFVADEADAAALAELAVPVVAARTLMTSLGDRENLARAVLGAAERLKR
ncbi:MAG TPA: 2-phospho-L-lactate transferase [Stellaceae bacterium]|jgi:LPPG:FO 2-phospho-L-lactate transferase|nr:2-phospho-L-lactate transferase [Stellaceae bacterium]